jgi:hypothetical protein
LRVAILKLAFSYLSRHRLSAPIPIALLCSLHRSSY